MFTKYWYYVCACVIVIPQMIKAAATAVKLSQGPPPSPPPHTPVPHKTDFYITKYLMCVMMVVFSCGMSLFFYLSVWFPWKIKRKCINLIIGHFKMDLGCDFMWACRMEHVPCTFQTCVQSFDSHLRIKVMAL